MILIEPFEFIKPEYWGFHVRGDLQVVCAVFLSTVVVINVVFSNVCGINLDQDSKGDEYSAQNSEYDDCFIEGRNRLPCFHELLLELVHDALGFKVLKGLFPHLVDKIEIIL